MCERKMLFYLLVFASIVTLSVISSTVQNAVYSSSLTLNTFEKFSCHNGSDYIDIKRVCDGVVDCRDGSDESVCFNRYRRSYVQYENRTLHRSKRQINCRQDQLQCPDETCVSQASECGIGEACVLPAYPAHGAYQVLDPSNAEPGLVMKYVLMTMSCEPGYDIVRSDDRVHRNETQEILCFNGNWRPKILPKCVSSCILDPDPSVVYICQPPGADSFQKCDHLVPTGTVVKPECNMPVYYSRKTLQNMNCRNGVWDYVAKCEPDCGRVTPEALELISNGSLAKRGELPWHVGIYAKTSRVYRQICGGSLVSNNAVISAAHCFWHDVEMILPASMFAVATGKLHRSWKSGQDKESQQSDVKDILIPEWFQGSGSTLQADVAVLLLVTPFVYKPHIKPICLNFDKDFDSEQLQNGKNGKVAGWGLTAANGAQSKELNVVEMPYIEYNQCVSTVPQTFKQFITLDKFCAGHTDGTAVCRGDSGGGLAFTALDQFIERYYLRGIVSAAPRSDNKECNVDTYATFTRVSLYDRFITFAMQGRRINWVPDIPTRDIETGVSEARESCGVLPPVTSEGIQYVPWHVGIYAKTTTPYRQLCGATLISNEVVISAAHCFWSDEKQRQLPATDYAAAVGKIYRPWNNPRDIHAQQSDVKDIKLPRLFQGAAANFQEDIAIVNLVTPFVYNMHVKPVCLHFDSNFDSQQLQPRKYGKLAGWGLSSANGSTSVLMVVDLPYIDFNTCISDLPPSFRAYITGDKFCAGYSKGIGLCQGISGGGLAFPDTDRGVSRYYLRGILSTAPSTETECYEETYATYTRITKHEKFIKEYI